MKYHYNITEDTDGFTVTFPDVPQAITCGTTREEAIENAKDCLLTALEFYEIPPSAVTVTDNFLELGEQHDTE